MQSYNKRVCWQCSKNLNDNHPVRFLHCITCQGTRTGDAATEARLKIYVPQGMITEMYTHTGQLRYMCHKDQCYSKRQTAVASSVAGEGSRNRIMYGLPCVT